MGVILDTPTYFIIMNHIKESLINYLNKQGISNGMLPSQKKWQGFKAVLFDMDGVLYDSMPNHAIAWQESMKTFGITMTKADAYATEGARGIDTIRHFMKLQKGIDITLDEAQKMYDEKTRIFHTLPETRTFEYKDFDT